MRGLNYDESVKESVAELRVLHRKQSNSLFCRRQEFLLLLKSGKCTSQAKAGVLIGIGPRASEKLWKLYRTQGVEALARIPDKGRPAKLTRAAKEDLQTQLDQNRVATLKQACSFVAQAHGIVLSEVAMHYYFKREKVKKKTGRPTNVHKDEQREDAFKKRLSPASATLWRGHLLRR